MAFVLVGGYTSGVFSDAAIAAVYPREIVSLHVAPEWQHRGVGRSLVRTASDWLITRNAKTVAVRALEPNPNRAFYVRLGAEEVASQPYDWAGFVTREIIYGWPDIRIIGSTA